MAKWVSTLVQSTASDRELPGPEHSSFQPWLDLAIKVFPYFKLKSVSLCFQSTGPKPSLWTLNKQVSFLGQNFQCLQCSPADLPWVFPLEDLVLSMARPLPWLLLSLCCPLPLVLRHVIYVPLEGEDLELNILLLMIKNSFIKQLYFDKCYTNTIPLEMINYHETKVFQEETCLQEEWKHHSKSLRRSECNTHWKWNLQFSIFSLSFIKIFDPIIDLLTLAFRRINIVIKSWHILCSL